jgi:DNA-binding LacI/PurR family transcriptional regulator
MAIADQLGYRPNILARGLTTRRTHLIGVVIARASTPFFEQFLGKLNQTLAEQGQRTLLLLINDRSEADQALEHALDYSVDGMVFVNSSPSPQAADRAWRASAPIVAMDKGDGLLNSSYVWVDGASIGRKVASLFIAEGRQRPVAVAGARGTPYAKELVTFTQAMEAATGRPTPLLEADALYEDGMAMGMAILQGPDAPDAIFTTTDFLACGIYDAARHELGLDVPRDLSIVGHGDIAPTRWLSYAISTVRAPLDTLVSTAVSTLMSRIADPSLPAINSYIGCEIIRRGTTLPVSAPLPAARRGGRRQ